MLPRNRQIWLCLFVILCLATPASGQENNLVASSSRVIRFFQDHISGADGNRCPMTPSCSVYAARAMEKHGPIVGGIMALDRVLRCGRSEMKLAPQRWIDGRPYAHDPVSANDFWWFEPASLQRP